MRPRGRGPGRRLGADPQPGRRPAPDYVERLIAGHRAEAAARGERAASADRRRHRPAGPLGRRRRAERGRRPRLDACGMHLTRAWRHHDRGSGEPDRGQYARPERVFGATGAAALFRRRALDDVAFEGGEAFDPRFHTFREDAELAFRLRERGWEVLYEPAAACLHRRFNLPARRSAMPAMVNYHSLKNRYLLRAYHQTGGNALRTAPWALGRDLAALAYVLAREHTSLAAYRWLWRHRNEIRARRRYIQTRRTAPPRPSSAGSARSPPHRSDVPRPPPTPSPRRRARPPHAVRLIHERATGERAVPEGRPPRYHADERAAVRRRAEGRHERRVGVPRRSRSAAEGAPRASSHRTSPRAPPRDLRGPVPPMIIRRCPLAPSASPCSAAAASPPTTAATRPSWRSSPPASRRWASRSPSTAAPTTPRARSPPTAASTCASCRRSAPATSTPPSTPSSPPSTPSAGASTPPWWSTAPTPSSSRCSSSPARPSPSTSTASSASGASGGGSAAPSTPSPSSSPASSPTCW